MRGDYPKFLLSYSDEELIEHFMLSETDQTFITQFRGDINRHGATVLLKSLQYLGYFPHLNEVPVAVKSFIAKQLDLVLDPSEQYPWDTRTRFNHFEWIRQYTGFRASTAQDKEDLSNWLRQEGAFSAITFSNLFEGAIQRLRSLCSLRSPTTSSYGLELPSEKELTRVVNSALTGFFSDVHQQVAQRLSEQIRQKIDQLLTVDEDESFSTFEKVKAPPGPVGVESLNKEIQKLHTLRDVGISIEHLLNIPFNVQKVLKRRAKNEKASEMRSHPDFIRYVRFAQ